MEVATTSTIRVLDSRSSVKLLQENLSRRIQHRNSDKRIVEDAITNTFLSVTDIKAALRLHETMRTEPEFPLTSTLTTATFSLLIGTLRANPDIESVLIRGKTNKILRGVQGLLNSESYYSHRMEIRAPMYQIPKSLYSSPKKFIRLNPEETFTTLDNNWEVSFQAIREGVMFSPVGIINPLFNNFHTTNFDLASYLKNRAIILDIGEKISTLALYTSGAVSPRDTETIQ